MAVPREGSDEIRVRGLEATIRRRDAVLAAISHAASRFLATADWDRDIRDVLAQLGKAAEVSRVYLFEGHRDNRGVLLARMRNEWGAEGVAPLKDAPGLQDIELAAVGLARWEELAMGDTIHGPISSLLASEREFFSRLGVRSVASVPVFAGERWWGFVGFTDDQSEREWSRSVLETLQAAAAMIGAAIYRMEAETELRRRETQLADAQAIAHMGSWDWDIETNSLAGSDEMYRIYGFGDDKPLTPGTILARVHPDDADLVRQAIDDAVNLGKNFSLEHRVVRAPGDVRILNAKGHVVVNADGKTRKIIGAGQDITELREAEAAARRLLYEQAARSAAEAAERRAAFLANASQVLGSSFDYATTLAALARLAVPELADFCTVELFATESTASVLAVAHKDPALEQTLVEVNANAKQCAPWIEAMREAVASGQSAWVTEITDAMLDESYADPELTRRLKTLGPRSFVAVPILISGRVAGDLALYVSDSGRRYDMKDVTLLEDLARAASAAVENARLYHVAEQATRARDQMLGVVAHDLRNPLGTIIMASGLLEETMDAQSPARRFVTMMHRAGERMNRLIGDLLDMKRMENGRLAVEPKPVRAGVLLTEAAEMLRPLAAAGGIELTLDIPEELPVVAADANRLQQVLSNLIGNAIKFTPKGGSIRLRGLRTEKDVCVAVSDTGPGIPAEQVPHIFGQFWQGKRADRRGIGLGLGIAKGIVEAHDGTIWVESTIGEGSTFYFTLPLSS